MKRNVFYNTAFQLMAKFVSMSLTVVATVLITRTFGKEGYGQFSLMQTLPALFYILADFGLNTTALKRIGSDQEKVKTYYQTVLTLRVALSIIFTISLNLITFFLPYSPFLKTGILMSSLLILTQAFYSTTNLVFQYSRRYDLASIGYIGGSVLTIALVVVFITAGLDIRLLSFAYVIGGTLTFLVSSRFVRKLGCTTILRFDYNTAKNLILSSLPLGLMFIFSQINFKADSVLLSVLKLPSQLGLNNLESVAVYSLPYKIFEVALVLPTFFMNSTYPLFVAKLTVGKEDLRLLFLKSLKYMLLLGLCTAVVLYILSPAIVTLLGGTQFKQSVTVLRILAMGLAIFFLTQPISYFIVTLDKQKYLPPIYLISAVFNVGANLIFIPKRSFYASSYITWISELLILLMLTAAAIKAWREYSHAN